jgi:hydrogenase/urease accessory protein HupE
MCGVAVHLQAVTVPADEILVALSVIALGAILLRATICRSAVGWRCS